ncbi:hypothetical protein [Actinoplanes utahensis]|uniref:Lipoprotein n=1 Tax=Actinoplanes utahensis TaxID=1869 RepID=A0A0A6USM4_ACTUT|nr:hypothetical protein [Actinoplanes utahensis]KHD77988.1 hypothetical protein MB27_07690 [Actinoplanes utahensis]GIF29974.1 lipoprotein [Actinoplanes utahensis]
MSKFKAGIAALAAGAMLLGGCGSNDSAEPAATAASQAPAGNGVAALTADEILTKAREALTKAGSYHVKGGATSEGQSMTMDFRVSGADLVGTMSISKGAEIALLKVGGKQYMRPSEGFWSTLGLGATAKQASAALGTKWLEVPASNKDMSGIFQIWNVDELLSPTGTASKGETADVDGKPAIVVTDSSDAESKVFVATTGEPYLLKIGNTAGDALVFTEFGATFADLKAPAAGQVIDMATLTGKK